MKTPREILDGPNTLIIIRHRSCGFQAHECGRNMLLYDMNCFNMLGLGHSCFFSRVNESASKGFHGLTPQHTTHNTTHNTPEHTEVLLCFVIFGRVYLATPLEEEIFSARHFEVEHLPPIPLPTISFPSRLSAERTEICKPIFLLPHSPHP